MAANNDITGDAIVSKPTSSSYRDNYDRIFRKKKEADVICDNCGQHYYEGVEEECIKKVNCGFLKSNERRN
jgi:ribosomal protein L37E